MDILWPRFLLLLGIIPLLIILYIWMLRRRQRFAVRFSSLSLVRQALSSQSRLRRHLPFVLFLLALTSLIVALVRPVTVISVPAGQVTVILAIDVSRSMCSTDIAPNRLVAAQKAVLDFIQRQNENTQIGIVAFSGFAELVHPPSSDTETLVDAVQSLLTGRRTAVGTGILEALDAIAEVDPNVAKSERDASSSPGLIPVPHGAYAPDIIVLLTDGASNRGIAPLDAAQQAADRGVRVYTIGFGTANGGEFAFCGAQFTGNEPFTDPNGGQSPSGGNNQGGGNFQGGGAGFRRGIDEETLMKVADLTGAEYYTAESASQLQSVFEKLPTYLITKHETNEVSAYFAALGAVLAALAVSLSLRWHPL